MRILAILLTVALLFGSCENDLDLVDDYKNIPVLYGMLAKPDSTQYFRLEKGFVDPTTSALIIAQNPDSLYYPNATIEVVNNKTNETVTLERIDGNLEGLVRDDGVFANDPNFLYKFSIIDFPLNDDDTYTVQINTGNSDSIITATTKMIGEPRIITPGVASSIDFDYVQPTKISFRGQRGSALFDVRMFINYKERSISSGENFVDKSHEWRIVKNIIAEDFDDDVITIIHEIDGINFYSELAAALNEDSDIERRFRNIDLVVTAGGSEIFEYVSVTQANTGFTSSQVVPTYTNLSSGAGLFSSIHSVTKRSIPLSTPSLDSLANGELTKHLNFRI